MAQSGFFDVNSFRSFPFVPGSTGAPVDGPLTLAYLPLAVVVDAGFILGPKSGYDSANDLIYLARIRRSGNYFYFDFESTAAALYGVTLTFTRHKDDAKYVTEFIDSNQTGYSTSFSEEYQGCRDPLWSGYLVTGDLDQLDEFLSGDGTVSRAGSAATVEPALAVNLSNSFVTGVSLANDDRTRTQAPDGCDDLVWPYPTGVIFVGARCLGGEVLLKPGYNAVIRQSDAENTITLGASVGAGEGEACAEVPLFEGEVPPENSTLLVGGMRCNEVLRSVNGKGGRLFSLLTGTGISITSVPEQNKLIVNVDMSGLATCYGSISTISDIL